MYAESEIAELKQQITRLRREMDELKQFIRYYPPGEGDDGKPEGAYLTIACTCFQLVHPARPGQSLITMLCSPDGDASIAIAGRDEKTRVLLQVDKDVPEVTLFSKPGQYGATLRVDKGEPALELYGRKGKLGVLLKVPGDEERGQAGVLEAGKPRAVMQATKIGGGISVVHDDGHARVSITSRVDSGDLLMVTPDMQVGVKISSHGQEGGFITVNRSNGKAGVIISNIATGGAVIVHDKRGKLIASLPSTEE
jgi:hypothetical protein